MVHRHLLFRGKFRKLRQKTVNLAGLQPGEKVLDVGCGTGTLAIEAARRVGTTGRVVGIDPSQQQIGRACSKAARRKLPVDFQIGVIEQLPFPDQTFNVALSTLMMHHLPANLKRQGLAEIARVVKPAGRLIITDFKPKQERQGQAARFHAGGSSMQDLAAMVVDARFESLETEEMGQHDSLLSQEQVLSGLTKAKSTVRAKRKRSSPSPTDSPTMQGLSGGSWREQTQAPPTLHLLTPIRKTSRGKATRPGHAESIGRGDGKYDAVCSSGDSDMRFTAGMARIPS